MQTCSAPLLSLCCDVCGLPSSRTLKEGGARLYLLELADVGRAPR